MKFIHQMNDFQDEFSSTFDVTNTFALKPGTDDGKNIAPLKYGGLSYIPLLPPPWRCGPTRDMVPSFLRFLDHIQRRITVGRTSMDE